MTDYLMIKNEYLFGHIVKYFDFLYSLFTKYVCLKFIQNNLRL